MSADDKHVARPKARGEKSEALCGVKAVLDGPAFVCVPLNMATCWKCIALKCGRPIPTYPPMTEHDRLKKAKKNHDATQLVAEFIDFLGEEGIVFARYYDQGDELYSVHEKDKLIAKFFEIDQGALESEKRALLDYMREMHEVQEWAKEQQKAFQKT